jgi:hypothetical protein
MRHLLAGCYAFPAHHQSAIFLLEPGQGPLGLEPWYDDFNRSAPMLLGLPDALRNLRTDPTLAELLAHGLHIIPFIRREPLQAFPGVVGMAGAHPDGIQQREDLRLFIAIGRREAPRQGYAIARREAIAHINTQKVELTRNIQIIEL